MHVFLFCLLNDGQLHLLEHIVHTAEAHDLSAYIMWAQLRTESIHSPEGGAGEPLIEIVFSDEQ